MQWHDTRCCVCVLCADGGAFVLRSMLARVSREASDTLARDGGARSTGFLLHGTVSAALAELVRVVDAIGSSPCDDACIVNFGGSNGQRGGAYFLVLPTAM